MKQTAVYMRVSTLDQESGIQSQEKALKDYIISHNVQGVKWYRDRLSGATTNRPAFKKLQADIFAGKVDTVLSWKLDRLSRSMRDGINILCEWISRDIRVVAISQQLDFSGPIGQMIAGVLFAIGQMELENLRENTKRGLAAARARGVKLGKRATIFADDIQKLKDEGLNMTEIAKKLGKTRQAVYAALKRG